ncbi:MAG: glycosyltransferase family 2 protein [Pseudomonadota bacterium]
MKNPCVSVILPVYDVEPYLAKCLDTVCGQTLENIEILVVNDCSPDNSDAIIQNYMKRDPRIRYIKHEENLGLGGARNTGIENAKGEYQWHIDSDDFIDSNACEFLYNTACANEVDVLSFSGLNFTEGNAFSDNYFARDRHVCDRVMRGVDFMAKARAKNVFYCAVWLNLVKSDFIKPFANKFPFRLNCAHQDTDVTPVLFTEAERVMCIHYAPYFRQVRADSITGVGETKKKMVDKLAVTQSLVDYIQKKKIKFTHPICEFAFKDFNYFRTIYANNLAALKDPDFDLAFVQLDSKFSYIKANYGRPFG